MSILSLFHICSPFLRANCLEKKEFYENFICSVCLDLCDTPVATQCNHICCYKCMYYSLLHKRNCPICKRIIKNNELKKITGKRKADYENIRIRCYLCNEIIKIKNHKNHLKECLYKRCKNYILGCEYYDKRNKIKHHEESCEHRLISCSSCSNLFYFKNRIFMLSSKEKYEMNIRCSYTYYSFYYNLLMNTNFNFFNYNHTTNSTFQCSNYISRKINILKTVQYSLDHIFYKVTDEHNNAIPCNKNVSNPYVKYFSCNNNNSSTYRSKKTEDSKNSIHAINNNLVTATSEIKTLNRDFAVNRPPMNLLTDNNLNTGCTESGIDGNVLVKIDKTSKTNEANEYIQLNELSQHNEESYNGGREHPFNKNISDYEDYSEQDDSIGEEFLNILPLRKNFNFKEKNNRDIMVIIEELFQFDEIDMSNIYVDNKEYFLCNKNCFNNTIKKLRQELERALVLLYFSCCVGMPAMFTLGCISYVMTKGLFKFSFLITNAFISLSHKFFFKMFYN
ncbi:zinc finger protein [Plasmodium brasilianum]|uniref:Zinc finger protein, putative n=2 Tax=Plasmodium (Plasmodium) TaxID=418103 RepID=A0A1D3PAD0_PLAMA|nr:zinc finger protein, putative [Plasmodium malariae]KAI4838825.1 zinc finger protein [Plasmodium brasilianum]SCN12165.1 zinc finger protein, putative [Plasmodium malariae]